jgi:hypothetical protein
MEIKITAGVELRMGVLQHFPLMALDNTLRASSEPS